MEKSRDDYIDPMYLPEDIELTQNHHIRLKEADALLQHWTTRQAAGERPLLFKKQDVPAARHGKHASASAGEVQMQANGDLHVRWHPIHSDGRR
jgi:hypothetical protein